MQRRQARLTRQLNITNYSLAHICTSFGAVSQLSATSKQQFQLLCCIVELDEMSDTVPRHSTGQLAVDEGSEAGQMNKS